MNKNAFSPRFIDGNHVLVTKEFAKNAMIFGTPEYKLWREIRQDCKDAVMVVFQKLFLGKWLLKLWSGSAAIRWAIWQ